MDTAPAAAQDQLAQGEAGDPWWCYGVDACTAAAGVSAYMAVLVGAVAALGSLAAGDASSGVLVGFLATGSWKASVALESHRDRRSTSLLVELVCVAAPALVAMLAAPIVLAICASAFGGVQGLGQPNDLPFLLVPLPVAIFLTLYGGALAVVWLRRRRLPWLRAGGPGDSAGRGRGL